MMADIKAKARKNVKAKPSFEVLDISEQERERGQKVDAYLAKKEAQMAVIEEESKKPKTPANARKGAAAIAR